MTVAKLKAALQDAPDNAVIVSRDWNGFWLPEVEIRKVGTEGPRWLPADAAVVVIA